MSTADKAKTLRADLKAAGWLASQISVRTHKAPWRDKIIVTLRDRDICSYQVNQLASRFESEFCWVEITYGR